MVRFFTFSGPLFYLFWSAFLPFLNKIKKRTQKNRILKNYLVRLVCLVRLVRFFMLLENEPFGLNNLLHHLLPYRYFQYVQRKTSILMRKHIFLTMHHL